MRTFKYLSIILVAALLLAACTPAATPTPAAAANTQPAAPAGASTSGELDVAVLAPLSGGQPTFGLSTKEGALLAINQWNAKGGVLGKKIVALVEDSQCLPDPAVNAANLVIQQDHVHYIIGEVCSKASMPVSLIADTNKVIEISSASTATSVTVNTDGTTKPYVFRACFIDSFQGKVAAKFAATTLKAKTAFIMADPTNDYVKGLADSFQAAFTAGGGTIAGREGYTSTDTDFSAILAKVAAASPDMVYLPDYYNIVNLVTKQAKAQGINVPFMGGDGWDSSDLDVTSAAGGYYTNHYSPDSTDPVVVNFLKDYGAAYKDDKGNPKVPDALAALAYDATDLELEGIKEAGVDNTDAVKTALEKINYPAVTGTVTFDAQHNPIKSAVILAVTAQGVKYNSVVAP
ncbi:MAG TPA: ABC transporter substrate-binding protein [Anaerolineaceae bacterium]|nr:ABC transporter substrate-binding protein [Anaerolineaceae bacterium]